MASLPMTFEIPSNLSPSVTTSEDQGQPLWRTDDLYFRTYPGKSEGPLRLCNGFYTCAFLPHPWQMRITLLACIMQKVHTTKGKEKKWLQAFVFLRMSSFCESEVFEFIPPATWTHRVIWSPKKSKGINDIFFLVCAVYGLHHSSRPSKSSRDPKLLLTNK